MLILLIYENGQWGGRYKKYLDIKQGYTQETYTSMIADRKKQLNELMWEFRKTLYTPRDYKY